MQKKKPPKEAAQSPSFSGLKIGSLFSGIGGLELGLEAAGLGRTIWQVEQNDFCRKVLRKHWPNARQYDDVRRVQVGLWFEFARVVKATRPMWVVVENVYRNWEGWAPIVTADLSALGFATMAIPLGGYHAGAFQQRERLFIVAVANNAGEFVRPVDAKAPTPREIGHVGWRGRGVVEPRMGRVVHGIPGRLDRTRIAALGNAVIPQCAQIVGLVIKNIMLAAVAE